MHCGEDTDWWVDVEPSDYSLQLNTWQMEAAFFFQASLSDIKNVATNLAKVSFFLGPGERATRQLCPYTSKVYQERPILKAKQV